MDEEHGNDGESRNIEDIVSNAMGDSVKPSRIHNPGDVGVVRSMLGHESIDGPLDPYLDPDEHLHYLFHTTSSLSFPYDEDTFDDEHLKIGSSAYVSPAVGMVTDQRIVFLYKVDEETRIISIRYQEIDNVEYHDSMIENKFEIQTEEREYQFGMWVSDPFASELTDAAAYAFDKAGLKGEYRQLSFDSDDFDSVQSEFQSRFSEMAGLAEKVDLERVVKYGIKGAKVGRGPRSMGVGFMLGAGYAIWSDLTGWGGDEDLLSDLDPDQLAEKMANYQQAANHVGDGDDPWGLVGGAIGAAVGIDNQTPGQKVPEFIASLDVEWARRQLTSDDKKEGAIKVASEVVDSYSSEISDLLDEDFIQSISKAEAGDY